MACYKCNVFVTIAVCDKAKTDAMYVSVVAGGSCVSVCALQKAAGNADDVQLWPALA